MKRLTLCALGAIILATGAFAVEPAYTGPYGNVEEPALRPYKWAFSGIKSLFYHSGKSVADGNLKFPVLGTVELGKGVRTGGVELGESVFRGINFAPVPQDKDYYKDIHKANEKINKHRGSQEVADAVSTVGIFTLFGYPVQKLVDKYPVKDEEEIAAYKDEREKVKASKRAARKERKESDLEIAQKRHIGDRASLGSKKSKGETGNLLKLAKKRNK